MELKRDDIIKALECGVRQNCDGCPLYDALGDSDDACLDIMPPNILSLIKSQDEKIFELENRLKECENGYEGTLYLDRCKLHDAEQKIKELTEDVERVRKQCGEIIVECDERDAERLKQVAELTEENGRLRAEGEWVHSNRGFDVRGDYECSLCHSPEGIKHFYSGEIDYKFCPNCGAKMKGEKNA